MPLTLNALSSRLLLASLVLLPLFLGTSGWYLERSHRLSIEAAEAERLHLQVLALIAQAEYTLQLQMPQELVEARLQQPNSGIYAAVYDVSGRRLWQSPSALTLDFPAMEEDLLRRAPGTRQFSRAGELFRYSYRVLWETQAGQEVPLVFTVLETSAAVDADLALYRRSLMLWLGGSAALLISCQLVILSWGLRPLRRLARDIADVESGEREHLGGPYPREVQAVTDNLETLLRSEQQRRERARNTLGDLAHSLKTPLAVIGSADTRSPDYPALVQEQTTLMEEIVSYQLQRAVGGSHRLLRAVPVAPVVEKLRRSLEKVYADRALHIEVQVSATARFRGDERDLMEMLGNLLDNACKYGHGRVRVSAEVIGGLLALEVNDDGEGVAPDLRERVLQRGDRADARGPGQGIGLAVVFDIASSYGGRMEISDSDLGGACIRLQLPA